MTLRPIKPLPLALLLTAFDGAWAAQAIAVTRVNAVSNVELVSLILWCFFHLPAALLCSALLKPLGWLPADPQQMPDAALWCMALLGLLQTFALVYFGLTWWQARQRKLNG